MKEIALVHPFFYPPHVPTIVITNVFTYDFLLSRDYKNSCNDVHGDTCQNNLNLCFRTKDTHIWLRMKDFTAINMESFIPILTRAVTKNPMQTTFPMANH